MEHCSIDYEDHPNQHENSQAMWWNGASHCEFDEKSDDQDDQNFPIEGNPL